MLWKGLKIWKIHSGMWAVECSVTAIFRFCFFKTWSYQHACCNSQGAPLCWDITVHITVPTWHHSLSFTAANDCFRTGLTPPPNPTPFLRRVPEHTGIALVPRQALMNSINKAPHPPIHYTHSSLNATSINSRRMFPRSIPTSYDN